MSRVPLDMADLLPDEPAGPCECCGEVTTFRVSTGMDDLVFCCLREMCKAWCFELLQRGD